MGAMGSECEAARDKFAQRARVRRKRKRRSGGFRSCGERERRRRRRWSLSLSVSRGRVGSKGEEETKGRWCRGWMEERREGGDHRRRRLERSRA